MKRLGFILGLILLTSINVKCQTDFSFLKDCISQNQIVELEALVKKFEERAIVYYGDDISEMYENYLSDLSTSEEKQSKMIFEKDFKHNVTQLRNSKLFKDLWIKSDEIELEEGAFEELTEIPPVEGETPREREVYYVANPKSKISDCLLSYSKNSTLNEIIEGTNVGGDISPTILAGHLKRGLKKSDFDSNQLRLFIAIHFYYSIGLLIWNKQ